MVQYIINLKVDLINPKAITENSKQSYINNPTKDIKWNKKHSINPKEGKKNKKRNKEQMGQTENKYQDRLKLNHINSHIKCK